MVVWDDVPPWRHCHGRSGNYSIPYTCHLTLVHWRDRMLAAIVGIIAAVGFVLLRGHPFLRTWLICTALWASLIFLGKDDPIVADEPDLGSLLSATYIGFITAAIIRGTVRAFRPGEPRSPRSPRSIGDTSPLGWSTGPSSSGEGRFDSVDGWDPSSRDSKGQQVRPNAPNPNASAQPPKPPPPGRPG